MPNFKGTRSGLGFNRICVVPTCGKEFEIYSVKQIRCRECAKKGKTIPTSIALKRGNSVYLSKEWKKKLEDNE